ncbi:MAG: glucose 1-dehydrogenase [Pseudomonadota bacterium]|nr:glucose 1-dehydrogenase [Pseudomonadota bacterium]
MRLQDKVCLITGGAAGIGLATARRFIDEGARVVLADRNEAQGQAAQAELGVNATFRAVDVAHRRGVQELVDWTVQEFGRLDVLVNNAGITRDARLVKVQEGALAAQMTDADFDAVVAVNLKGVFNCAQAAAPAMIRQQGGVILNASSISGLDGNFGQTNYTATKAGVVGMTKVWARELGPHGIRVNAVAPGFIATGMTADMPPRVLDAMRRRTPLGLLGEAADIAAAYAFLASDEARFVTGAVLRVDGGLVLGT